MNKPDCMDCGSPLNIEHFHDKPWYVCQCGSAMPISRYKEFIRQIKKWKRSKIGRVWNNPVLNK